MCATRLRGMNLPTGEGPCLKDALEAKLWFLIGLPFPRWFSRGRSAVHFFVHVKPHFSCNAHHFDNLPRVSETTPPFLTIKCDAGGYVKITPLQLARQARAKPNRIREISLGMSIPFIKHRVAWTLVAEMGTDYERLPLTRNLANWVEVYNIPVYPGALRVSDHRSSGRTKAAEEMIFRHSHGSCCRKDSRVERNP